MLPRHDRASTDISQIILVLPIHFISLCPISVLHTVFIVARAQKTIKLVTVWGVAKSEIRRGGRIAALEKARQPTRA